MLIDAKNRHFKSSYNKFCFAIKNVNFLSLWTGRFSDDTSFTPDRLSRIFKKKKSYEIACLNVKIRLTTPDRLSSLEHGVACCDNEHTMRLFLHRFSNSPTYRLFREFHSHPTTTADDGSRRCCCRRRR